MNLLFKNWSIFKTLPEDTYKALETERTFDLQVPYSLSYHTEKRETGFHLPVNKT